MRTKNMNPPKKKKSATENAGNILLVPIHDPERGDRAVDLLGLKMSDELESHPRHRKRKRLVGALPTWPCSSGWGYYPMGGLGLL
jgi:hypothetical protein